VLLSMTGFGEAKQQAGTSLCRVELRSVNNRHFKLNLRSPDGFSHLENEVEKILRDTIARGTVSATISFDRSANNESPRINLSVLKSYWDQLQIVAKQCQATPPSIDAVLNLPNVIDDGHFAPEVVTDIWPVVESTIRMAAEQMAQFRRKEGASMRAELLSQCGSIESTVDRIAAMAPQVVTDYRDKIMLRVNDLIKDLGSKLTPSDVLREVALFADKCDITEEITRLRSHLVQFRHLLDDATSQGKKLDFMCQELFREVNTIGSKANNTDISHAAVEAKVSVERMREIVQNVE